MSQFDFQQFSPHIFQVAGHWLGRHSWVVILVLAPLFILFIAHRLQLTRWGTDPRWLITRMFRAQIRADKNLDQTIKDDGDLPDSWGI